MERKLDPVEISRQLKRTRVIAAMADAIDARCDNAMEEQ